MFGHLPIVLLSHTLISKASAAVNAPGDSSRGAHFDKYIIVVMENQDASSILEDTNFKSVADQALLQTNYHAVTHPSQPNCKI